MVSLDSLGMRQVISTSQVRRSGSSKSLPTKLLSGDKEVLVKPVSRKN